MVVTTRNPNVALLCSPGMGHLIPMLELGKSLISQHGFDATVFVVTTDSSTTRSQIIQQTSNPNSDGLNVVVLPPVDLSGKLGPNSSHVGARIRLTMAESLPFLRSAILSMKVRPSALIVDLFGTDTFAMARDLEMLTYVFFTSCAWVLALAVHVPVIEKKLLDRHVKHHEPLPVPGCKPVRFEDNMEPILFKDEVPTEHELFVQIGLNISNADGVLVNTWEDLEPKAVQALRGGMIKGKIYPVGPLVRGVDHSRTKKEHQVLSWLDRQPAGSVIFVSFGSGGTMSEAQMEEIASGLELSEQRFIWVVRPPHKEDNATGHGSFFKIGKNMDNSLKKFTSRTHESGLVVPMWAPQSEILEHSSVGAFMTHCGWNSTLEAITNGVPMIAWPLYAEQKMNAAALTEELGVAVRVKGGNKGEVVERKEIQRLIRRVMVEEEGVDIKERVKELKRSAKMALSETGSSFNSLHQLACHCKVHM
ncbi:anthocyanidin 3-O-glucosyltransferase 5-like [Prosopis cineraria]|uniref:anthocyanidin 3-O-glucosyltransferase 5-like n=1 Tax=Prosopis cineraria TaxID=364024 RepID=UPI00240EE198|nr:anthocyanidin 3-O-glucosyltransferase 5-like [Prosopis cineraria]